MRKFFNGNWEFIQNKNDDEINKQSANDILDEEKNYFFLITCNNMSCFPPCIWFMYVYLITVHSMCLLSFTFLNTENLNVNKFSF